MDIITPRVEGIDKIIKPVDDKIISALTNIVFNCDKDTDKFEVRNELYTSIYTPEKLEKKEEELTKYLSKLDSSVVETQRQNSEYNWVKLKTYKMRKVDIRFYLAPNPDNMHELVKKIVDEFKSEDIPVGLKYQLTTGMQYCDRIIIYSDYENANRIENAIKKVSAHNPNLFEGCERSIGWLYDTSVPGLYKTPETPGSAYSDRLATAILDAKAAFNYLYGLTSSNSSITLEGEDAKYAFDYMKLLISSMLLKHGLIMSKDGRRINIKESNIKSYYDIDTGVLKFFSYDNDGYHEVSFLPTKEGRKAFVDNFYIVSSITPQLGIETRHLTLEERRLEVDKMLYPHKYEDKDATTSKRIG